MSKFQIGKKYVVELRDSRSVHILREHSVRERIVHNLGLYIAIALKAIAVLVCVAVPPLLIPLILYYKGVNREKDN